MEFAQLLTPVQLANALALSSLLTILASGLALIFGLRDVMNFAHGAFYMLGAYLGYTVSEHLGYWGALLIVPAIMVAVGALFEIAALRPLQRRSHMDVALVTVGVSFVVAAGVYSLWGTQPLRVAIPGPLDWSVPLLGEPYPVYRLFLIAVGFSVCTALALWLRYTRSGMYVRAVSQQPHVTRMMGVNTERLGMLVVSLGCAMAGLAGVLAGPYLSVDPGMGASILISCLVIVVVGGLGSIAGAVGAAVLLGFLQVIGSVVLPSIAVLTPYLLLFVVLLYRPQGFGRGRVA